MEKSQKVKNAMHSCLESRGIGFVRNTTRMPLTRILCEFSEKDDIAMIGHEHRFSDQLKRKSLIIVRSAGRMKMAMVHRMRRLHDTNKVGILFVGAADVYEIISRKEPMIPSRTDFVLTV